MSTRKVTRRKAKPFPQAIPATRSSPRAVIEGLIEKLDTQYFILSCAVRTLEDYENHGLDMAVFIHGCRAASSTLGALDEVRCELHAVSDDLSRIAQAAQELEAQP